MVKLLTACLFSLLAGCFALAGTLITPERSFVEKIALAMRAMDASVPNSSGEAVSWNKIKSVVDIDTLDRRFRQIYGRTLESSYFGVDKSVRLPLDGSWRALLVRSIPLRRKNQEQLFRYVIAKDDGDSVVVLVLPDDAIREAFRKANAIMPSAGADMPEFEYEDFPDEDGAHIEAAPDIMLQSPGGLNVRNPPVHVAASDPTPVAKGSADGIQENRLPPSISWIAGIAVAALAVAALLFRLHRRTGKS